MTNAPASKTGYWGFDSLPMHMENLMREQYLNGYISGTIGYHDDWSESDVEFILGGVLKKSAHGKWWLTPIPRYDGATPRELWNSGNSGRQKVIDLVIDYLSPSFG
jgi:hypothetical protein